MKIKYIEDFPMRKIKVFSTNHHTPIFSGCNNFMQVCFTCMYLYYNMRVRGVINQECESLHKICRNKVTEVLACKKGINVVVRFQYSEIG